jgi:predicted Zn-dependent protease
VSKPLPKRLADELARASRPGKADVAMRAAEKLIEARSNDDLKEAKRLAIRTKQAAPRSPWIREQLGLVAFSLEDWHEAGQELLAYRRFTGDHRHDAAIAETYRRQAKAARALEFLSELKQGDVSAKAWTDVQVVRARALADTGRTDAAITLLKQAARTTSDKRPIIEAIAELSK